MFSVSRSARPDRCELCKWAVQESRWMAPPPGSVVPWNPGQPYGASAQGLMQADVLVCKRMPPTPNERGDGVSPIVGKGNYCGEFEEA